MVLEKFTVELGARSYDILIGPGLLGEAGRRLREAECRGKIMLVSNEKVYNLYGEMAAAAIASAGYKMTTALIPDGEEYKTLATAEALYNKAFDSGLDRGSAIVSLGGGITGDLAGFVAATYMRGIAFVQLPTTLLAQVDSSVGGKVGVNHPAGKNIIGAFHQPRLVLADTATLGTLEAAEIRAGLAEVIKYGVIWDGEFLAWLEEHLDLLLRLDPAAVGKAIGISCRIKSAVVAEDEREQGIRAILNFGHTVGHAVEALTGYRVYRHGEAVAIGMAAEARLAVKTGRLDPARSRRLETMLGRAGLPVAIPPGLSPQDLLASMLKDKKTMGGELTLILPNELGRVEIVRNLAPERVLAIIAELW
jgi:3-dehydroquinate synthase